MTSLKSLVGVLCFVHQTFTNGRMAKLACTEDRTGRRIYKLATIPVDEKFSLIQVRWLGCQYKVPRMTYSTATFSPHMRRESTIYQPRRTSSIVSTKHHLHGSQPCSHVQNDRLRTKNPFGNPFACVENTRLM